MRLRTKEEWGDTQPPFTMGHEIAGWVAEIGQGVVGFKSGEPVAVVPLWGSCGHCPPCRRGEENFCYYLKRMIGAGIGFDGGLAEYIVVEARYVVPIGDFDHRMNFSELPEGRNPFGSRSTKCAICALIGKISPDLVGHRSPP